MPTDANGKPGRALLTPVEKITKKSEIDQITNKAN